MVGGVPKCHPSRIQEDLGNSFCFFMWLFDMFKWFYVVLSLPEFALSSKTQIFLYFFGRRTFAFLTSEVRSIILEASLWPPFLPRAN